jgi:hypothetical protein
MMRLLSKKRRWEKVYLVVILSNSNALLKGLSPFKSIRTTMDFKLTIFSDYI